MEENELWYKTVLDALDNLPERNKEIVKRFIVFLNLAADNMAASRNAFRNTAKELGETFKNYFFCPCDFDETGRRYETFGVVLGKLISFPDTIC